VLIGIECQMIAAVPGTLVGNDLLYAADLRSDQFLATQLLIGPGVQLRLRQFAVSSPAGTSPDLQRVACLAAIPLSQTRRDLGGHAQEHLLTRAA